MFMKRKKVMLHYSQYGIQRSPNDQQDLLRSNEILKENFEFITLDQPDIPSECGHIHAIVDLYKKIKEENPDIVHIIGIKEGFHCMIASFLAKVPRRIIITRGFAGYAPKQNLLKCLIFSWLVEPLILILSTYVHCNSYFSYNQRMIRLFARNKRMVIYNFLNFTPYNNEHLWRKQYKIRETDFVVATVGNMHVGKGYDLLQKVINHFKDNEQVKFVTMGGGALYESFVSENKLNKNVIVMGKTPHPDVVQILSESNVFYLPTRYESLGMVYAEAGACRLPSIGTNVGAVSEIIKNGETGFLLQVEDYKSAIDKIEELINNRFLCTQMGNCAHDKVFDMFSSQSVAKGIIELYSK